MSKVREVSTKKTTFERCVERCLSNDCDHPTHLSITFQQSQFETFHSISLIDEITLYLLLGGPSEVLHPARV